MTRENFDLEGSRVFILDNFLSPEECQHYISESERVGYNVVKKEFIPDYRNNERLTVNSHELATVFWDRASEMFEQEDLQGVRPYGFDTAGVWKPNGVDKWFKFSKYPDGSYYRSHMDAIFVLNSEERTIYTLNVFLNDDFEGGNSLFFDRHNETNKNPAFQIEPKAGRAVIFNHDTRHAEELVTKGTKYVMSTEIVFKRTRRPTEVNWEDEELFMKAKQLYQEAEDCEVVGQMAEAFAKYSEAMALQTQHASIPQFQDNPPAINKVFLDLDLCARIFRDVPVDQMLNVFLASKIFYKGATCDSVWYEKFSTMWPNAFLLEDEDPEERVYIRDWFRSFRHAYVASTLFQPFVVDIGKHSLKYGLTGVTSCVPVKNIIATIYNKHHNIKELGEDDLLVFGQEVFGCIYPMRATPMSDEFEVRVRKMLKWCFNHGVGLEGQEPRLEGTMSEDTADLTWERQVNKKRVIPSAHPFIVAIPPGGFGEDEKEFLEDLLVKEYAVPYLAFVKKELLTLIGSGARTGVVVHLGTSATTVTALWDGEVVASSSFSQVSGEAVDKAIHELFLKKGGTEGWLHVYDEVRTINDYLIHQKENSNGRLSLDYENEIKTLGDKQTEEEDDQNKTVYFPANFEWLQKYGERMWQGIETTYRPAPYAPEDEISIPEPIFSEGRLHELVAEFMGSLDAQKQEALWKHMVVSGGNSCWEGFEERFEMEMKKLRPSFKLVRCEDRVNSAIVGGQNLARTSMGKKFFSSTLSNNPGTTKIQYQKI
eukprot:CAMPEP_0174251454 /NCGR_PEP_ID=MMETSP0439-20130205/1276_1 /TAXON_ID=0 /ORGANISM="Stereomyxa ramosa, Strain Chinc5" /LENGTH=765 /DNA_ID=CAMNT_0015331777 /DNA_START=130 /DNA_END=2427 /DNA_ORIENTATION=+